MTRFSPPIIYQCPACAGYFKRHSLISLFFDDVPEWSDGKSGQWWASASGSVGRCPVCSDVVWFADAVAVMRAPCKPHPIGTVLRAWHRLTGDRRGRLRDEQEWDALSNGVKSAERIDGLSKADDFIEALDTVVPHAVDREVHLRQRLWWASNDYLRLGDDDGVEAAKPAVAEDVARANALRLLELIERDPKAQVERGDLLRQLGRFDEAVAVLKAVALDGHSEVKANKIQRWAKGGNSHLQMINTIKPKETSCDETIGTDRPVSNQVNLSTTVYTIHRGTGPTLTFDQIKDRQALEGLHRDWRCKLLRVLLYKLHQPGD